MTSRFHGAWRLVAGLAIVAAIPGCGLKGALVLPEKSGNVVVREQSATTGSGSTAAPAGTAAPTGTPAAEPDAPPLPEKMPPPELPRSNNGTSR
jgi:predicted small lipoprotein YifL